MISPRGGSAKRAATSAASPRTTSSCSLVSSRQTASGRAGSRSASAASVAGSRRGDSKATTGRPGTSSRSSRRPIAAGLLRQEPGEDEPAAGHARGDQRGGHGGRARQHLDREPGRQRRGDQPRAGIGDGRHPGIGEQADPLARADPLDQAGDPRRLVVLGQRDQRQGDAVAAKQRLASGGCPRRRPRPQRAAHPARAAVTSARFPIGVGQTTSAPLTAPARLRRARRRRCPGWRRRPGCRARATAGHGGGTPRGPGRAAARPLRSPRRRSPRPRG